MALRHRASRGAPQPAVSPGKYGRPQRLTVFPPACRLRRDTTPAARVLTLAPNRVARAPIYGPWRSTQAQRKTATGPLSSLATHQHSAVPTTVSVTTIRAVMTRYRCFLLPAAIIP